MIAGRFFTVRGRNTYIDRVGASASLGMCLAEWLMVLGVITILLALIGSFVALSRERARSAMIQADFEMVLQASRRFYAEYQQWPTTFFNDFGDTRYGTEERSNQEVINALRGLSGPGNQGHALNPNRIVYVSMAEFSPGLSGLDKNGAFLDPWGQEYQVVVDSDMNGDCTVERSIHGLVESEPVLIWSCGPDKRTDTQDDVVSWGR